MLLVVLFVDNSIAQWGGYGGSPYGGYGNPYGGYNYGGGYGGFGQGFQQGQALGILEGEILGLLG